MLDRFRLPVRVLFALILLVLPARAAERETVTWMEAVFPPFFIQHGVSAGQGYGDVVSAILREQLTGYEHQTITTNITRHFYKFKQGENVCSVGLYRTPEREAFMHFSIPSFLTLPAVLIVRKDRYAAFGGRPSVRLDTVLSRQDLTIGLARDRSYGPATDAILRKHGGSLHLVTTNITRHFYKFRQGEKVCSVGLYRTPEREAFMHFSIPSFLTLPAVLIVRKERHADFDGRASVRLAAVLAQQRWTIGLARDRSYGPATDRILQRHAGDRHLLTSPGQELSRNLFRMLMLDRLDGLIGLPEENLYQAEQLGIRDQLMTLTIDENQQGYDGWLSSVGCSKNEWGRRIIAEIDRILLTERATERYRRAYERWLDPNSIRVYRRVYRQVFLPGGRAAPRPAGATTAGTGKKELDRAAKRPL